MGDILWGLAILIGLIALLYRVYRVRKVRPLLTMVNSLRGITHDERGWVWADEAKDVAKKIRDVARELNIPLRRVGTSEEELEALVAEAHRVFGRHHLQQVRREENWEDLRYHLSKLRDAVAAGAIKLEEIGSSEEELIHRERRATIINLREWLEGFRRDLRFLGDERDYIIGISRQEGISLADLGTSEEELDRLRDDSIRALVRNKLEALRCGKTYLREQEDVEYILSRANSGLFTLADLGTSEEELTTCVHKVWVNRAKETLQDLRKPPAWVTPDTLDSSPDHIRTLAQKYGFTLADLGTDDAELDGLLRNAYVTSLQCTLYELRTGHPYVAVERVTEIAAQKGIALEELGTSAEELSRLTDMPKLPIEEWKEKFSKP